MTDSFCLCSSAYGAAQMINCYYYYYKNLGLAILCPKSQTTGLMAVTLSNVNRFSKLFHSWKDS